MGLRKGLLMADVPDEVDPDSGPARRLVLLSWLMVPLLALSLVLAVLLAALVLGQFGITAAQPLYEQGGVGWLVFIVANLVVWPLPSYLGIGFGIRASRLGEAGRARWPIAVHAVVIGIIWLLSLAAVVREA